MREKEKASMVPGIDPKIDIAFKKMFGSPQWSNLTRALIDAVLQPDSRWETLSLRHNLDQESVSRSTGEVLLDGTSGGGEIG